MMNLKVCGAVITRYQRAWSSDVGIGQLRSDSFDDHRRAASTPNHNTPAAVHPDSITSSASVITFFWLY
ncbi:hypothetical protein HBI64_023620 [Parastagonospora nodorum]|nr:hypothetical protein HBH52_080900 [Parastagonospora nodorum]KAH4198517.1 hypothetical protein HBH42_045360 [Parastagonospora nodorum]KAH4821252.1 hypothetical protein HBH61_021690 [Parastagonospora nodorum]KAH5201257.1 hypothetical protein HBH68_122650 [Parastagonospora nodorum]KAH5458409.1 hypothetical protein HBI30_049440 [Parastagonospora nodorum]